MFEVVSVMVMLFSGMEIEARVRRLRFSGRGLNCFWRGGDVFGSVRDFFGMGWDYFRGVEFVKWN